MCGRYSLTSTIEEIQEEFEASPDYQHQLIFNGAPSLPFPVIANQAPGSIQLMKWGFMPQWGKKNSDACINSKCEGIDKSNTWKRSLQERRCIVIASGFIEWSQTTPKQPYYIYVKDKPVFGMAGIWRTGIDFNTGEEINGFSIITTSPNELMDKVKHHRMPVILDRSEYSSWLNEKDPSKLCDFLNPYPYDKMNAYPISTLVNKPANNSEEILKPIGEKIL